MADISPIQTIFLSSLVGALVSYLGAWLKSALEMRSKIDEKLLDKRTRLYKNLWAKTKILPKWPREDNVTYRKLVSFSSDLRKWYFDGGGLYLSRSSQKAYAKVQDAIWSLEPIKKVDADNDKTIKYEEYDLIRKSCSKLRTRITKDLQSRKAAPFV